MAQAPGRPVEAPSPFRLSLEPPVDRVPRPAGGSRPSPERVPGGPRAQRTTPRWPGRSEAGDAHCPPGRHPHAPAARLDVRLENPPPPAPDGDGTQFDD